MDAIEQGVRALIEREQRAWETGDADLLLTVFHPDMVWPFPRTSTSVDPLDWSIGFGRFDAERWRALWQHLFDTFDLVHDRWTIRSIQVAPEGDAALAVVDLDALWRAADGTEEHWHGRVARGYTQVGEELKLIFHTGALEYGSG